MTAVEAVARFHEEMISTSDIKAYHGKAVELCVATLRNKERPISAVQLFWFGAAGESFPFVIDSELKMNNRMPFSKMKDRFPHSVFSRLPCLSQGEAAWRGDVRVGYCEIRGYNDPNNNIMKTAEYLSLNKWIGIINTSEGAKVYLMPTCTISHDLGVTQANYPQMLHGIFIKKNRENRGHAYRLQPLSPSERAQSDTSPGSSGRQQEEVGVAVGGAQRRRVSFAPMPTEASASPESGAQGSPLLQPQRRRVFAVKIKEEVKGAEGQKTRDSSSSDSALAVKTSSVESSSEPVGVVRERDTRVSPSSEVSEEGSTASSLSSSASPYEYPSQAAMRGRGRRGRPRGRGKRGSRGRGGGEGGTETVEMGEEGREEVVVRGRGGRGRKRRGRGTRGARGRGRGKGDSGEAATQREVEDTALAPVAKRARVSLDLVASEEKSARANNSALYQLLDSQAASITPLQQVQIQMVPSEQPPGMVTRTPLAQQRELPTISEENDDREKVEKEETPPPSDGPAEQRMLVEDCGESALTGDDGGSEEQSLEALEKAEVKESDLQVQEEVVSALQSEQEASDPMEVDSGPFFQPPRPPRRVSLLEYKERMREKKKQTVEEPQQGEATSEGQKMEQVSPKTSGKDISSSERELGVEEEQEKVSEQEEEPVRDDQPPTEEDQLTKAPREAVAMASRVLQSVIDSRQGEDKPKSKVPEPPTSSTSAQETAPPDKDVAASIDWPDEDSPRKSPVSEDIPPVAGIPAKETSTSVEKEAALSEGEIEKSARSRTEKEKREKDVERQRRPSDGREQERDRKKEETEKEPTRKVEPLEKDWRARRERERKLEREKRLARKIGKPLEAWTLPSFSDQIPTHSSRFSPGQQRFNIPLHPGPRFSLSIPSAAIPSPQPPPPQPFLSFPAHPFHQPPPPAFPPPPPPPQPLQTEVWNMFGNLFAQQNLFPSEDPPPPPPRSPSPARPPIHPPRSPSPHRVSSPHLVPPTTPPDSPRGKIRSVSLDLPSFSSSSLSPTSPLSSKLTGKDPKPLDAKQFKIISELIKRTTVKKCDVAVQVVPPRMVSEGTQSGRGLRLRSTSVQARPETQDRSTLTDSDRPEVEHRYVQTGAESTHNMSTQTQTSTKTVGVQTTNDDDSNPLTSALETFESALDTVGCTYPAIDAIVTRVEDWLSRQASFSTDTGSTSDYEPADMSCDEDDKEEEDCNDVFVSPRPAALPSPVVSGASNISDGDLSDMTSPTPSESGKTLATGTEEGDHLYSPSHPLESGEECVEEEHHLPSPPPPPPGTLLLFGPPSSPPPSPPSLSSSKITEDPLWASEMSTGSKPSEEGWQTEDKHSEEKADTEEAFADQLLEEQFSKNAVDPKKTIHTTSPLACLPMISAGKQDETEGDSEATTAERARERRSEEEEKGRNEKVSTWDPSHTVTSTGENQQTECSLKSSAPSLSLEATTEGPQSMEGETSEGAQDQQNTATSEDLGRKFEESREDDDLPLQSPSSQTSGSLTPMEAATRCEPASSPVGPKTRAKRRSGSYRSKVAERASHSAEGIARSQSHSGSPSQRERSEKVKASTSAGTSARHSSKTETKDTDESLSQSSARGRHKYETRHRRRSEAEEKQSVREERWELRSRRKRHSEDSSSDRSERRELRPRKKKEDGAEPAKSKGKRTQEEKSQEQILSSASGRKREMAQSKLMVPTLQAFEDEESLNESSEVPPERPVVPRVQGESGMLKSLLAMRLPLSPKPQTEEKRVVEEEEKKGEIKEGDCILRSLSLPPFKVALVGTEAQMIATRSISHSPPGMKRRRPTLTKDELLAMVRAKKRSGVSGGSPVKKSDHLPSEPNAESGEKTGTTLQAKLDMNKLISNFQQHMQAVSARKVSDASWIHPQSVGADHTPSPPPQGVISFPRGPTYSLRNPPPPPPGPPPSSVQHPTPRQPPPTPQEAEDSEKMASESECENREAMEVEETDALDGGNPEEVAAPDSTVESAELKATEETVSSVVQDMVDRAVEERLQSEEIFHGRFLDTLEARVVQESVRTLMETAVGEKVTELIYAEEVLQERTLEAVELEISGEIVELAFDGEIERKVVELLRAESVLQERVLDALEDGTIHDTVAELVEGEVCKEARCLVHAAEILEEEAVKSIQKMVICEMLHRALDGEMERKVVETVKSEEFLQERAVSVVEKQVVQETVMEALREKTRVEVLAGLQSWLVDAAIAAAEDELVWECEETVAREATLEGEVSDLVTEEALGGFLEEWETTVAKERENAANEIVAGALGIVEEEASEWIVCESLTAEAVLEETLAEVLPAVEEELVKSATDVVAGEILSEEAARVLEDMVGESLLCNLMDKLQSQVASELAQAEEGRRDDLVGGCIQALEEGILREFQSDFAHNLMTEALVELEETVINCVEQLVLQEVLQDVLGNIIACFNLELRATEIMEDSIFSDMLGETAREMVEEGERVVGLAGERVTSLAVEEILEGTEGDLAREQAGREHRIIQEAEEDVTRTVTTELVDTTEEKVAGEITGAKMAEEHEAQETMPTALQTTPETTIPANVKTVVQGITEVILITSEIIKKTQTHIRLLKTAESARESRVMYEVTEVVPDSVAQLRATSMQTHVHVLDSGGEVGSGYPESQAGGHDQHSIDPLQQAEQSDANTGMEGSPHKAEVGGSSDRAEEGDLAPSVIQTGPVTPDKGGPSQSGGSSVTSPVGGVDNFPSLLVVPEPLVPKCGSHHVQLRPSRYFPPLRRSTSLSPTLSPHGGAEAPSSGEKEPRDDSSTSPAPTSEKSGGKKKSRKYSTRRKRRRNSSGSRQVATSSLRTLRPRNRSQSCSSAVSSGPLPVSTSSSPPTTPSPTKLTQLTISSMQITEQYNTALTQSPSLHSEAPPQEPVTRPRRGSSKSKTNVALPRETSCAKKGNSSTSLPKQLLLLLQSDLAVVKPEGDRKTAVIGSPTETAGGAKESGGDSPENDDVFIDGGLSGAPDPQPSLSGSPDPQPSLSGSPDPQPSLSGSPDPQPSLSGAPDPQPSLSGSPDPQPSKGSLEPVLQASGPATEESVAGQDTELGETASMEGDISSEGYNSSNSTPNKKEGRFWDIPHSLDLSSIPCAELESPEVSPATGNSSSPTSISPHSAEEEEMVLRLEASLSSAPETDSDQDRDEKSDAVVAEGGEGDSKAEVTETGPQTSPQGPSSSSMEKDGKVGGIPSVDPKLGASSTETEEWASIRTISDTSGTCSSLAATSAASGEPCQAAIFSSKGEAELMDLSDDLSDLLASAHKEFMSAPIPTRSGSKTPSPSSERTPSTPVTQLPVTSGEDLRPEVAVSTKEATWKARDRLWQSFSDNQSDNPLLPSLMGHPLGRGGGGASLSRQPRQHHHSVSGGYYNYPHTHVFPYAQRNREHSCPPPLYSHPPLGAPPGLFPFPPHPLTPPPHPLTPPPHYPMPHPPPHDLFSPPHYPSQFPLPPPPGPGPPRSFIEPRHRYRSLSRYHPFF